MESNENKKFPRSFWTANVTELFERGAYYAMASFVVIYLGQLGLGDYWPSVLNGVLWTLIYFLPILSGTIADQVGFRKSLILAFILLTAGYLFMGSPVWSGGAELSDTVGKEFTAGIDVLLPLLLGILLIGVGARLLNHASVDGAKTAVGKATLGFAIFYMVINIGSLFGRGVSYAVRTKMNDLSLIFAVAAACSILPC